MSSHVNCAVTLNKNMDNQTMIISKANQAKRELAFIPSPSGVNLSEWVRELIIQ